MKKLIRSSGSCSHVFLLGGGYKSRVKDFMENFKLQLLCILNIAEKKHSKIIIVEVYVLSVAVIM